ncbi:hypothetical protein PG997_014023 [Apiospora hydei]|uniref:Uncharacterized protein n=1 Tax=Apiospora hydei TaxID=1337664 RepID=A0ABR1V7V5_9PEZI
MHLLSVFILVNLASSACGNFWVFEEGDISGTTLYPGYRFFNCDEVKSAIWWQVQDDVSGDKKGVRAEGTDLLSPDILEVHVDNVYFTIYKHINYAIYDVEANYRGFCQPVAGVAYNCVGDSSTSYGRSVYHCTCDYVAVDMN